MKSIKFLIIILIGILSIQLLYGDNINPVWQKDINKAFKLAKKYNKKILLAFCAPWCSKCKRMQYFVCNKKSIVEYLKKYYVPVKIDITIHPDIKLKYKIKDLPTFIFIESDGKTIILIKHGYIYSSTFYNILKYIAQEKYKKK